MPLPLLLLGVAALAGTAGVAAGVGGAVKMKNASDKIKEAKLRDERNNERLQYQNENTCSSMDKLGKLELNILASFKNFAEIVEKIKNKPKFADVKIGNTEIPKFDKKGIEDVYVGASILISGLGGAALGTAGGFAASGATTAAVMALGTASTGTAISSLTGVAATNATLAALGGGSLAAGGGGMALGATVLGGATLGVGLLVGGIIFNIAGNSIKNKAGDVWNQMIDNEKKINRVCSFLINLKRVADSFYNDLNMVNKIYESEILKLNIIVKKKADADGCVNYTTLNDEEKLVLKNTTLLVGLLFYMCKVKLVNKSENTDDVNTINYVAINEAKKRCTDTIDNFEAA